MKIADNTRNKLIMKWMAAVMSLAYSALGLTLLLSDALLVEVPWSQRLLLGAIIFCYGLFRGYRFVATYYINKEKDSDEE